MLGLRWVLLSGVLLGSAMCASKPVPAGGGMSQAYQVQAEQPQAQQIRVSTVTDLPMAPGTPLHSYGLSEGGLHAELLYEAAHSSGPAELLYTVWKGDGPRSFEADRSIGIERRVQLFGPLFGKFLATEKPAGSLQLQVYGFAEFDDRLAVLAAQDAGWDLQRGQPRKKLPGYDYYAQLLEHGGAAAEIDKALRPFHYVATLRGGIENLRVAPYGSLPAVRKALLKLPVKDSDLIPERMSVTFTLKEGS